MSNSLQYGFDDLPLFKKGPYSWDIKNLGYGNGFKVDIYYEGKFITEKRYDFNYVYIQNYYENNEINKVKEYRSEEAITRNLQWEAQYRGFGSDKEVKQYPSLTDLGIENSFPGDEKDGGEIDIISLAKTLNLPIPELSIPSIPPSGSIIPPEKPAIPKKIKLKNIKGVVVDSTTNEPLAGVKVTNSLLKRDTTNKKGEFKIKHPVIEDTPLDPTKFSLNFTLKKYSPTTSIPYNSVKQLKLDLGIITLKPTESDLKKEITNLLRFPPVIVEDYATKDVTVEFKTQKGLNKSISDLKSIVIPMILGLISKYGVSKVQELIEKYKVDPKAAFDEIQELITCPPREEIDKLIATKNKLTNKINNTLTVINQATDILITSEKILGITSPIIKTLRQLPLPTAVGGVGIPVSVINGIRDTLKFLDKLVGRLLQVNTVTLAILNLLKETLSLVLSLLTFLDLLTQFCYPDTDQSQISEELTALTQQQTQQLSPAVTNVNGFEMGVETEITDKPLKRRRAIARNKSGVVMLKGEWSFSSVDQILIDELVFYIQQNNLKAD